VNAAASMTGDYRVNEMVSTGQVGTKPVLQSTQCCQISFPKVNYHVIYKLLIWGLPWVNNFEAWNYEHARRQAHMEQVFR
jgi:hypothetical protein